MRGCVHPAPAPPTPVPMVAYAPVMVTPSLVSVWAVISAICVKRILMSVLLIVSHVTSFTDHVTIYQVKPVPTEVPVSTCQVVTSAPTVAATTMVACVSTTLIFVSVPLNTPVGIERESWTVSSHQMQAQIIWLYRTLHNQRLQ